MFKCSTITIPENHISYTVYDRKLENIQEKKNSSQIETFRINTHHWLKEKNDTEKNICTQKRFFNLK